MLLSELGPKVVSEASKKVAQGKVVAKGAGFTMLNFNKLKVSRVNPLADAPLVYSSLYVPQTSSAATLYQYFARQKSEATIMMYTKLLGEMGLYRHRNNVCSYGAAIVQSPLSSQLPSDLVLAGWLFNKSGKKRAQLTHFAHCQVNVNAMPVQAWVPTETPGLKKLVTSEFAAVGIASDLHNYVDLMVDKTVSPKFVAMINALLSTESPLTHEQLVAAMQYLQRCRKAALKRTKARIEEALKKKEGSEEDWAERLTIVTDTEKLTDEAPLPEGLSTGLVSFTRGKFLDGLGKSNL